MFQTACKIAEPHERLPFFLVFVLFFDFFSRVLPAVLPVFIVLLPVDVKTTIICFFIWLTPLIRGTCPRTCMYLMEVHHRPNEAKHHIISHNCNRRKMKREKKIVGFPVPNKSTPPPPTWDTSVLQGDRCFSWRRGGGVVTDFSTDERCCGYLLSSVCEFSHMLWITSNLRGFECSFFVLCRFLNSNSF